MFNPFKSNVVEIEVIAPNPQWIYIYHSHRVDLNQLDELYQGLMQDYRVGRVTWD